MAGRASTARANGNVDGPRTKMMSVRFPIDLLLALREFARRNGTTVTGEMVRAVRAHLLRHQ